MKRILFAILTSVLCLTMQAQDQISASIETVTGGRAWDLSIGLANNTPYTSFQLDVVLPDGVAFTNVTPDQRISSLVVTAGMVSESKLRVTAYNASSQASLSAGSGVILSIRFTSEAQVSGGTFKITNCLFTSVSDASEYVETTLPAVTVDIPEYTGPIEPASYKLTYIVDGVLYKELMYEYGAAITPEPAPEREGYTFSGWSEIPATMPEHDVTVTGTFSINSYKLTYMVDGEVYKEYTLEYGVAITPEPAPTKVDWEFSGWKEEIPATMPAHDVTITGVFDVFTSINSVSGSGSNEVIIYRLDGVRTNKMTKGLNIINGRKVVCGFNCSAGLSR